MELHFFHDNIKSKIIITICKLLSLIKYYEYMDKPIKLFLEY